MKKAALRAAGAALLLVLGGLAPMTARAQANGDAAAPQTQQSPAGRFVQNVGNQAVVILADKSLSQDQRTEKYRQILRQAFDLKTIGRFVLGRAWNSATPQQQQEYQKLFEELVLKIYGDRLNFYNGENFKVTGTRPEGDKDTVVTSKIVHPDGPPTTVDWRVRQNGGNYAIVDVSVEGVSQTITQRQEFASILARNGGNIDDLLNQMRARVQGNGEGQGAQ